MSILGLKQYRYPEAAQAGLQKDFWMLDKARVSSGKGGHTVLYLHIPLTAISISKFVFASRCLQSLSTNISCTFQSSYANLLALLTSSSPPSLCYPQSSSRSVLFTEAKFCHSPTTISTSRSVYPSFPWRWPWPNQSASHSLLWTIPEDSGSSLPPIHNKSFPLNHGMAMLVGSLLHPSCKPLSYNFPKRKINRTKLHTFDIYKSIL